MYLKTQSGFITIPLFVAFLIGVALVGGGVYFINQEPKKEQTPSTTELDQIETIAVEEYFVDVKTAKVGDRVGPFTVSEVIYEEYEEYQEGLIKLAQVSFSGIVTIEGTLRTGDISGPSIDVESEKLKMFPIVLAGGREIGLPEREILSIEVSNIDSLPKDVADYGVAQAVRFPHYEIKAEIKNFSITYSGKDGTPYRAEIHKIINIERDPNALKFEMVDLSKHKLPGSFINSNFIAYDKELGRINDLNFVPAGSHEPNIIGTVLGKEGNPYKEAFEVLVYDHLETLIDSSPERILFYSEGNPEFKLQLPFGYSYNITVHYGNNLVSKTELINLRSATDHEGNDLETRIQTYKSLQFSPERILGAL